jgi:hemerythrin superfamily protein
MDILDLITADHNRVRGILSRLKKARQAEDGTTVTELGTRLFRELRIHARAEEDVFYAWVGTLSGEIAADVAEGCQEHHEVDVLMAEADQLNRDSMEWRAKLKVVAENTEHHMKEEEDELMPAVRSATNGEDRERVGRSFETVKAGLGAPTLAATIDLTTTELRRMASQQAIPGRSKMSHDQLAAAVSPE